MTMAPERIPRAGRLASAGLLASLGVALGIAAWSPGLFAQQLRSPASRADTLLPGRVTPLVVAFSDSTERYALYLPSTFAPARRWPVLFVMDPRGRALLSLRLFRRAAEARGWIVLSSYNTVSDSSFEPNERAVEAMLDDAQRRFPVDTARVYLAGFSGTARLAWVFALALRGHAAGILAFGAGLPNGAVPVQFASLAGGRFSWFGGAGVQGFNHDEVRALEGEMRALGIPTRLVSYPGPHAWPPASVAAEGVGWLELRAMRDGLTPVDGPFIDSLYERERSEARTLDAAGEAWDALRAYRAVVEDFGGWRDVETERERVSRLAGSPAVRRREGRERALAHEAGEYRRRVGRVLREAREAEAPLPPGELMRRLAVDEMENRAATGDSLEAAYVRRMLADLEVRARFYEPRAYLAAGEPERALAVLAVAERLSPGRPGVCLGRARALAVEGRDAEAFRALRCAAEGGVPRSLLVRDPYLAPLRADPRWEDAVEAAGGRTTPPRDSMRGRAPAGG